MNADALTDALARYETLFDPDVALLKAPWHGPGYHSKIPNGQPVHGIRESLDYVLILLESGTAAHVGRARDMLEAVLRLQETNPVRATYGIWPYVLEESLEEMQPPDWNWADFCGVRLGHALMRYRNRLGEKLRGRVAGALEAAAFSIFRRNVGPGYTNIAIKGAVVSGIAGEILGRKSFSVYAEERLRAFLAHCRQSGGFSEYNSPPYGEVVLHELERGLLLLRAAALREQLGNIHFNFWEAVSQTLHLPTGQLCGPQSRAYADRLPARYASALGTRLGITISGGDAHRQADPDTEFPDVSFLVPPVACPREIRDRIVGNSTGYSRYTFVRSDDPDAAREACVWRGAESCLGTISYDNLWVQRRPLLGYWRTEDGIASLRVRMKNGPRDFASGTLRMAQSDTTILAAASLATNKGNFHDHMDRPADGVFEVDCLELVVELSAPGARVSSLDHGFSLEAGEWAAVVDPGPAWAGPYSVKWECSENAERAEVRALINDGAPVRLDPAASEQWLISFALGLFRSSGGGQRISWSADLAGDRLEMRAVGGTLALSAPLGPGPVRDHFTR